MMSLRNSASSPSFLNPDVGENEEPLTGDMGDIGGTGEVGKETVFKGGNSTAAPEEVVLDPHLAKVSVGREGGDEAVEHVEEEGEGGCIKEEAGSKLAWDECSVTADALVAIAADSEVTSWMEEATIDRSSM